MCKAIVLAAMLTTASIVSASADVVISTDSTSNMSCSAGVCVPTATDAVLNVTDLENFLASGNVKVATTNGSVQANNIDITAAFSWSAASSLALDAYQSISFSAVVQNLSTGNVLLITNDGGSDGALTFAIGQGRLDTNAVSINGETYTMASSVKQLASAVIRKPYERFALSRNTDAGKDGVYYNSPIPIPFGGAFNGLGHKVSNLEIVDTTDSNIGLFAIVKKNGLIASVSLRKVVVRGGVLPGALVGENYGTVSNVFASGVVSGDGAGGLVGANLFLVTTSQSAVSVRGKSSLSETGGLVGGNSGSVTLSFATGDVSGQGEMGGLIGVQGTGGVTENCYALGNVAGGSRSAYVGGFIGRNYKASVATSYAIGAVSGGKSALVGGFDGANETSTISNSYWDTDTSGTNQGSGDGNDAGITGLTTAQFQSGLPAGFDPSIWAEDASINNGFPYLIANPPAK
jgi:hypothetical protein